MAGWPASVYRTPYSIGYVEQSYSKGLLLPSAAIRNKAGHYVIPSIQSAAADAAQKPTITPTDFSIVNQPGASSYPITGYSWALVYAHQPTQATGQQLVSLLDWLTHAGQTYAAATSYVPLPPVSSSSPTPCSSKSPAQTEHACWAERTPHPDSSELSSAALGDLDGDVGGFDGGDREHSWLQAEFVGGFAAEQ